jgi:hypothetical protein
VAIYFVPFAVQALVMFVDEFYFHRKRGLPLWERVGHPIDSLTVFISYLYISLVTPSPETIQIYIVLCVFSCLMITKDEFVHKELCEAKESWLHSVLFVIHPICFLSAGLIWKDGLSVTFLAVQPILILSFMMYQVIYWSLRERN